MEYLEFELPIKELEEQLAKCLSIGEESDIDVSETCAQIQEKLDTAKKEIYKNLTPWQRVQMSRHPNRPYTLDYIHAIFEDSYLEVFGSSQGLFKDKGSKFIAYTFHIKVEDDVKTRIAEVRKKEYAARHHCYAYVLNPDKSIQRDSDDGEPSNTAGKPILGQLLSNDLTNTLIIVVRLNRKI